MQISKVLIATILIETSMSFQLAKRAPIGWVSPKISTSFTSGTSVFATPNDVLDVEFEPVDESSTEEKESITTTPSADPFSTSTSDEAPQTLLDISLDSDPDLNQLRIPFVDPSGRSYIDCKMAFMVDVEGVSYAIGVPYEYSAGISFQKRDGTVTYMSPDDDENEELMQIMAGQLQQEFGEDVSLKRTPRVLTISGDLDKYTKGWREKMFETVDTEGLLDDTDETTDFFLDFMKKELGEEEVNKVMASDTSDVDEDMIKLFDLPGFGTQEDDVEGVEKMLENMFSEDPSEAFDALSKDRSNDGVALKLVGFNFKDGKSYSLVQMLTPCTLVAKQISDKEDDDDMRFELLSPEEEKIVLPRLETLCEKELKEAGLTL